MASKSTPVLIAQTKAELPEDVQAVIDRAVRAARGKGWCLEFSQIAGAVFGIPDNEVTDSEGLNCKGFASDGFNKDGRDANGYDREGFGDNGFNREGRDREGYDREGMNAEGIDRQGRDKYRYDANGYDVEGYHSNGYRREAGREWYTRQAARPAEDFMYDRHYNPRPKSGVKATASKVRDTLGF